jgi:hydrogenase maturation protease
MVDSVSVPGFSVGAGDREPTSLLIVGLGNPMMADDGIGHAVVERLKQMGSPRGVRVEALAGDVLGLAEVWEGEPDVWVVDAVSGGSPPGSFREFEHQDLLGLPAERQTAHQLSLGESLRWLLHARPEMATIRFRLCGIEIGDLRPEFGLSPVVDDGVNRLVDALHTAAQV